MADGHPVIEQLHVENYRVLRDVTFRRLEPLTVLFGPNGSGKSTVFDVFAFLHDSFEKGLRAAVDDRNRMSDMRSKGADGPIVVELKIRETMGGKLITYRLEIDEKDRRPYVRRELLQWPNTPGSGRPRKIVDFSDGTGTIWDDDAERTEPQRLASPDVLAVSTLGALSRYHNTMTLRNFINGWYLSYIRAEATRGAPQKGPAEQLSQDGSNLPNVLQFLQDNDPERLGTIFRTLRSYVPQLEKLLATPLADGRLMLELKDRFFEDPVLARFVSDGTLKLLAYLTVLNGADLPAIIGIEEPENQLHPRLLGPLAQELGLAAQASQVVVTTHSPDLLNAIEPREAWVLYRDDDTGGFTNVMCADTVHGIREQVRAGGKLGWLWMHGFFPVGDPLSAGVAGRSTS